MSEEKLQAARKWMAQSANGRPYAYAVVRGGYLIDEQYQDVKPAEAQPICSMNKSVYCSMLGIAIAEGKIQSAADLIVKYYPQVMDAAGEHSPYPDKGRKSEVITEKDRAITLRQLASQVSGFTLLDQRPGQKWHYQTFGMVTLMHVISFTYGYYDHRDPHGLPGDGELIREKIRDPIGGGWRWDYNNFQHPPHSRINIFGNMPWLHLTPHDMLRLGWLWLNWGRWGDRQVIPEAWQRESARVSPLIKKSESLPEDWRYGYGFWVNEFGRNWKSLPPDCYCAAGFGSRMIWMCPSLNLVVVLAPGLDDNMDLRREDSLLLPRIVEACTG